MFHYFYSILLKKFAKELFLDVKRCRDSTVFDCFGKCLEIQMENGKTEERCLKIVEAKKG